MADTTRTSSYREATTTALSAANPAPPRAGEEPPASPIAELVRATFTRAPPHPATHSAQTAWVAAF